MAVAIEDAGCQIRDQIMWVYGSGFPKSHNISKGIDKAAGAEREVIKTGFAYGISVGQEAQGYRPADYVSKQLSDVAITAEAKQWQGWGTALKPAHEPIVVARKPLEGTVAANVLTWGVGGLNIDGTRVGTEDTRSPASKTALGIINDDGWQPQEVMAGSANGRWPANVIHDGSEEVVALFPDTKAGIAKRGNSGGNNFGSDTPKPPLDDIGYADSGSAARFFYCAKASKRDRNEGFDGFEAKRDHDGRKDGGVGGDNPRNRANNTKLNHHPTVKPTSLMQYLVRLVTPPNGVVLDPFMGSGSTGKACAYEGFDFIGIEMSAEYLEIAKARIQYSENKQSERLI
jgi:site-specific DNA-methyltransferase (adenine-specific)